MAPDDLPGLDDDSPPEKLTPDVAKPTTPDTAPAEDLQVEDSVLDEIEPYTLTDEAPDDYGGIYHHKGTRMLMSNWPQYPPTEGTPPVEDSQVEDSVLDEIEPYTLTDEAPDDYGGIYHHKGTRMLPDGPYPDDVGDRFYRWVLAGGLAFLLMVVFGVLGPWAWPGGGGGPTTTAAALSGVAPVVTTTTSAVAVTTSTSATTSTVPVVTTTTSAVAVTTSTSATTTTVPVVTTTTSAVAVTTSTSATTTTVPVVTTTVPPTTTTTAATTGAKSYSVNMPCPNASSSTTIRLDVYITAGATNPSYSLPDPNDCVDTTVSHSGKLILGSPEVGKDTFRITFSLVGGAGATGGTDPVTARVTWTNP